MGSLCSNDRQRIEYEHTKPMHRFTATATTYINRGFRLIRKCQQIITALSVTQTKMDGSETAIHYISNKLYAKDSNKLGFNNILYVVINEFQCS